VKEAHDLIDTHTVVTPVQAANSIQRITNSNPVVVVARLSIVGFLELESIGVFL
jgi:ribosomal protein L5